MTNIAFIIIVIFVILIPIQTFYLIKSYREMKASEKRLERALNDIMDAKKKFEEDEEYRFEHEPEEDE